LQGLLLAIELNDRVRERGAEQGRSSKGTFQPKAPTGATGSKSAKSTGDVLGVSPRTVERARTIIKSGDEEVKRAGSDMRVKHSLNCHSF